VKKSTKIAIINILNSILYSQIMPSIEKVYFIENQSFGDSFWQVMQRSLKSTDWDIPHHFAKAMVLD
jgi:hypothetical protein